MVENAAVNVRRWGMRTGTAVHSQSAAFGPADVNLAGGLSPMGTMGQSGNVMEWEETEFDLVNDGNSDQRGLRGGHYNEYTYDAVLHMSSYWRGFDLTNPNREFDTIGFRVASAIPEPGTALLAVLAALGITTARRRR